MYTKDEPWQTCNLMSDTTSIVFDLSLYLCRLSIEICAIAMCQSQWTSEHGPPGMCGKPENHAKQNQRNKLRYLARVRCRFHLCHGVLEHFSLLENLPWATPNVRLLTTTVDNLLHVVTCGTNWLTTLLASELVKHNLWYRIKRRFNLLYPAQDQLQKDSEKILSPNTETCMI